MSGYWLLAVGARAGAATSSLAGRRGVPPRKSDVLQSQAVTVIDRGQNGAREVRPQAEVPPRAEVLPPCVLSRRRVWYRFRARDVHQPGFNLRKHGVWFVRQLGFSQRLLRTSGVPCESRAHGVRLLAHIGGSEPEESPPPAEAH